MKLKYLLTSLLALATICSVSAEATWQKIKVNGTTRDMKVYVPQDIESGAALVIACHGMNQDANWHDSNSKWAAVSDTAKFVLVFPEGIDRSWDLGGNRDVDFICAIIDKMAEDHEINKERVYLTGFSMGGMFTYHCANRISDKIAAFVPVSGYPMWDKTASSSRPVPILHVHGTGDDVCVFSGVQPTLDNWIKRNKCNTTPEVIKPYPANKKNSDATLTKWTDGLDGVEVQLLEFKGKGHWQSEDPSSCLTSVEAWNFMQRWNPGPDAPKVTLVEPENGSFDLPTDGTEINITFDINVKSEGVEAILENGETPISLEAKANGNILTLSVPALQPGEYKLVVNNVTGENEGLLKVFKASYTFGYEEVDGVAPYVEVFNPDLKAEKNTIGEGIPSGWHRINSSANGVKDEKGSGSANTGGARLRFFNPGGDFTEGFYLCARSYDRCDISYGKYAPEYALHFEKGLYRATFNSIYWNESSMNDNVTFDFTVNNFNGNEVASFPSLPSSGNMKEQTNAINGSYSHSCDFDIPEDGDYIINYSISSGKQAIILGNFKIATAMTVAERYKGTFMYTLKKAEACYESITSDNREKDAAIALHETIEKYKSLVSTAPSVYVNATKELEDAIAKVSGLSAIEEIWSGNDEIISVEYFNMHGQHISTIGKGVVLERVVYRNGNVRTVKKIF